MSEQSYPRALRGLSAVALAVSATASAQVRVVNYNVAQLKGDSAAIADVLAAIAVDDKPGFAVAPHVIVFQEVRAVDVDELGDAVAAAIPGISYIRATYTTSASEDAAGGAQAMFYRSDTVTEIVSAHKDLSTGANRKSDRWQLQLVGYSSLAARFYVYGSHLKASPGATNEAERLAGVQVIRDDSDALADGTHIIYCGDFNLYSNSESAYLEYLSAGPGQAFDPLGTGSWSGIGNAIKHTQSPRDIMAGGLVGGGMDDRFDFQLSTAEMQDANGLSLIAGTYRAFGNDGQHFNAAINSGNNSYWPDDIPASNLVADALFDATDHIPIVCDYQVPAVMHTTIPLSFGRIIRFTPFTVSVSITNIAAGVPQGIDSLEAQVVGTGALSGSVVASAPIAPDSSLVPLTLNTTLLGVVSGGATVNALSQATQAAFQILSTSGTIVRPSNGSFSASSDVDFKSTPASVEAGTVGLIQIPIHNFLFDVNQSLLDVDLVSGASGRFALSGMLPVGIGATPGTLNVAFDANGAASGTYSTLLTIFTSDENIPGETDGELVVEIVVTVEEQESNPADVNADGVVDGADLGLVLGAWGSSGTGDVNGDGVVDGADLSIVLGSWS